MRKSRIPYGRFPPLAAPYGLPDENNTFNDEGDTTTGWTATRCTIATSNSVTRHTKNVAAGIGASSTVKSVTFVPSSRDWILYGKVRVSDGANHIGVVWFLNGSSEAALWFGTTNGSTTYSNDAVSLVGYTTTRQIASAESFDYTNNWYEFALQFDAKYTSLVLWRRREDGSWLYVARVACNYFAPSPSEIQVLMTTNTPQNAWIEWDYLTLCRPNMVVIGDSLAEGKTLYSPDRSLALTNFDSTWMRWAKLFPQVRNNIIVNKGVGSQTSATIAARMADATDQTPRIVFLHASSNDEASAIALATRTTNLQSSIDSIKTAGAKAILLNAMCATAASSDNTPTPDLMLYTRRWWEEERIKLSGVEAGIDITAAVRDPGTTFMRASLAQADGIHPNVSGYTAIGQQISNHLNRKVLPWYV